MCAFRQPGTVVTDHVFEVPLDHGAPGGELISVFARQVVGAEHAGAADGLPWLLFLQGGPGGKSPRPNWLETSRDRAPPEYRVPPPSHRGARRSTPASRLSL